MLARNQADAPEIVHLRRLRERIAIVAAVCRAEALMERDPDAAAVELDGLLGRILAQWQPTVAQSAPPAAALAALAALDAAAPLAAMRLRLALRAPNVRARVAHLWQLIAEAFPDDTTLTQGCAPTAVWTAGEPAWL